jgi:hypothetical membrane protein
VSARHARFAIAAAVAILVATIVGVALATPGYRVTTDAVSRLGSRDEPWRLVWRAGLVGFGVLVALGASAIAQRHPVRRRTIRGLVLTYGLCTALVGLAPKDPPGAPHTLGSHVHVDAAILAGALLLGAIALVARDAPRDDDRRASRLIGAASVAAIAAFPFLWGTRLYGLTELFLLGNAVTWLLALAFAQSSEMHGRCRPPGGEPAR